MNRSFYLTMVVSLLIHLAIFQPWGNFPTPAPMAVEETARTVEVRLPAAKPASQAKPEKQPEDKPPARRHLEDDISKANHQDGHADTPGGKRRRASEQRLSQLASQQQAKDKKQASQARVASPEVAADAATDGQLEASLENPEEARARWYNAVLKRIGEQVHYIWVKPAGVDKHARGAITMELDSQGYLLRAWVQLPSGSRALDDSALLAIRAVIRYQVPSASRHYRHLTFSYSGAE